MLNPDPKYQPSIRRPATNSKYLVALIIVGAIFVASQYTSHPLFPAEETSMLWGMLTGLIIGGWIFGWLKRPWQ
jgi:hypothetical protein